MERSPDERAPMSFLASLGNAFGQSECAAMGAPTMTRTSSPTSTTPFDELDLALRGKLIRPGDPDYDSARAVYNGMIDRRPAAIARCCDSADVIAAVGFGRTHGIEIALRGG